MGAASNDEGAFAAEITPKKPAHGQELHQNALRGPSEVFGAGHGRERISTMQTPRNYADDEQADDAWVLPIGWNRKVDRETGQASSEPRDPRFLSNEI